ncbi:NIPSNAP family protein [Shewanella salipaludis]|uniref:NIPSNAP family protein n=1 Tax=Shewanella salipaludis TaxID=2723052 RepID=A0A972FZ14_9GAMM|nr:NIPSNAP family protein [Shewanella salipaludis]NMH64501.1 NIPSNAP family protein [Shewanella salipaludis]
MTKKLIEIRTYKLKKGSGNKFHQLVANQSMPLHLDWGMDVVVYGQSVHDEDAYFLIRAYDSLEHLEFSQNEFYATEQWRNGPRQGIVDLIESDVNATLWLSNEAIESMKLSFQTW